MRIGIRVDSSSKIGSGHVHRCLALAHALNERGNDIVFFSKCLPGNIISKIIDHGFEAKVLNLSSKNHSSDDSLYGYDWLGSTVSEDLCQTLEQVEKETFDWFVVDHYGLDNTWEDGISSRAKNILVIDDLGKKRHNCTLLLNQNLGLTDSYSKGLSGVKHLCLGAQFAILKDDFMLQRDESILLRKQRSASNVMISMGGVDKDNVTLIALHAIKNLIKSLDLHLFIVLGEANKSLDGINEFINSYDKCELIINTNDMAGLMKVSDVALSACGISLLERCAMGLPMLNFVLAENQRANAQYIQSIGAGETVWDYASPNDTDKISDMLKSLVLNKFRLNEMSKNAALVTDGSGMSRLIDSIYKYSS